MKSKKTFMPIVVLLCIVLTFGFLTKRETCSECGKKFAGVYYGDPFLSDPSPICRDCAPIYFAPFDYTRYEMGRTNNTLRNIFVIIEILAGGFLLFRLPENNNVNIDAGEQVERIKEVYRKTNEATSKTEETTLNRGSPHQGVPGENVEHRYEKGNEPEELRPLLKKFLSILDEAFPEGVVVRSEWDHDTLDKLASYLCMNLGFKNGSNFLNYYGYSVVNNREDVARLGSADTSTDIRTSGHEKIKYADSNACQPQSAAKESISPQNLKTITPVAVLLAAILTIALLTVKVVPLLNLGKKTIDLNKYVTIETSGYDTLGTAWVYFDENAFLRDNSGKIKINSKSGNNSIYKTGGLSGETIEELLLKNCVDGNLSKISELCNGDTIVLEWDCEDAYAEEYFNVRLKYTDVRSVVDNLIPIELIDPFDYIDISFQGISPKATIDIKVENSRPGLEHIKFSPSQSENISNGSLVTIDASIDKEPEQFAEEYGYLLSVYTTDLYCNGLPYYIRDLDDIPADALDDLVSRGRQGLEYHVSKDWNDPNGLVSADYIGCYILGVKPNTQTANNSICFLLYNVKYDIYGDTGEFIYVVAFEDLMIDSFGTFVVDSSRFSAPNLDNSGILGHTFKVYIGKYFFYGFKTVDEFREKVLTLFGNHNITTSF